MDVLTCNMLFCVSVISHLKKTAGLFLLAFFVFTANIYAQAYKIYDDSAKRFKVSIPETWTYIPNYKETLFLAHRPLAYKGESKIENVALSKIIDTSAGSMEDVYTSSILASRFKDSTLLLTEQGTSPKANYRWYISKHRNSKTNETIMSMTIVFYVKKQAYILQCTASAATFAKYKNVFMKIADSLQFK